MDTLHAVQCEWSPIMFQGQVDDRKPKQKIN